MKAKHLIAMGLLGIVSSTAAVAQQSTDGPYVLHEFFVARDTGSLTGRGPANLQPPQFGPGKPPTLSLEAKPGEPIYAKDGPLFDQPIESPYGPLSPFGGANKLDDRTDRVDSLTYFANFDPSVIPYKRVVVQNHPMRQPTGEYAVERVADRRVRVETSEKATPDMELFWGTFLLRLEAERWHPLASVAPDQRILAVQTEPDIAIEFFRDDADNFFVRTKGDGLVRLNVEIGAPRFYFAGEFSEVGWDDFPTTEVPPLDPEIRVTGVAVARQLGFSRDTSTPRETLVGLVEYFRDFDARPFPDSLKQGDLYEAIALNQIGVCRHRSLAFVITAQALGIPTRYVNNEAHAFVEVFWPTGGWRRVDLGGAANELNASANNDTSLHDPGRDALPTPQRFIEERDRMERNGWDVPDHGKGPGEGGKPGDQEKSGEAGESGAAEGQHGAGDGVGADEGSAPEDVALSGAAVDDVFTPPPTDERGPSRLAITDATAVVRRGNDVRLGARLTDGTGRPLSGREIEFYIGPVGSTAARDASFLGRAVTDAEGRVRTAVRIPKEHAIGRWSIFVVFGGDAHHQPAVAE